MISLVGEYLIGTKDSVEKAAKKMKLDMERAEEEAARYEKEHEGKEAAEEEKDEVADELNEQQPSSLSMTSIAPSFKSNAKMHAQSNPSYASGMDIDSDDN